MIEKTFTGLTLNNFTTGLDLPYGINDTFFCKSKINFCCTLNLINSLLGLSISSGNIANYKLLVRISNDISSNTINTLNFYQSFNLTTENIIDSNIVVNIKELTDEINDEYLLENMNGDDIFNLYKNYKIIFRIYSGELSNLNLIENTDIIQNINFVLNTTQSGPYDVSFKNLDVLSPQEFTDEERLEFYSKSRSLVGMENLRLFYPSNIQTDYKCPLFFIMHGNYQFMENYDSLLSHIASYGYFAASLHYESSTLYEASTIPLLRLISHIKDNIDVIYSGFFADKLDFTKINLSGHSRGGDQAEKMAMVLEQKGATYSIIGDISINNSDLKSLVTIGRVTDRNFTDGAYSILVDSFGYTLNAETEKFLIRKINKPTLNIVGKNDGQAGPEAQAYFMQIGFDNLTKRNTVYKYCLSFDMSCHDFMVDIYSGSFDFNQGAQIGNNPISAKRIEINHGYNYNDILISYFKSHLIQFLSINNFNNDKLKKLKFYSVQKRQEDLNFNNKYPAKEILFTSENDTKYFLDDFYGKTLSFAGSTGLTFTNLAGICYGYAIDTAYFDESYWNTTTPPINEYGLNLIRDLYGLRYQVSAFFVDDWLEIQDEFNGIMDLTYKGMYIPIESNFILGYTFSSALTLEENNYFSLKGCLKYFTPATAGNTLDAQFQMTLHDLNGNSSSLTSKMYSNGFEKNNNTSEVLIRQLNLFNMHSAVPSTVCFRAGDFYIKNPNLGLTLINQITLNFGPDYGSTFAHLVLDEFVVYKNF